MTEPDANVVALAEARARARAMKDFATADALRARLAAAGWTVVDESGGGWRLLPARAEVEVSSEPLDPHDVPSLLTAPATHDVSAHWVAEG